MSQLQIQYYKSPYGELVIGAFNDQICLCDWRYRKMRTTVDNRLLKGLNSTFVEEDTELLRQTKNQLDEYFKAERKEFTIPLLFVGTEFQKTVWNALLNIDYGTTSTYLKLSEQLGNEDAIRAVATANGANAISIIVPCHRVIGTNGELVGYAGGLAAKQNLLRLENSQFGLRVAAQTYLLLED